MVISFKQMFEEVNPIDAHDPNWPALNRTDYLIEHACVPQYVPTYCAEAGQLFAALAEAVRRNSLPAEHSDTR